MAETSSTNTPRSPAPSAIHPWRAAPIADARDPSPGTGDDPVTDWLLEQQHLDDLEFAVLFAIHKHNGRHGGFGWIRRTDLCRSTGLDQPSLTRVLDRLRYDGWVGMSRHPVDSGRARYLLIVGRGTPGPS